jgi:hypothetical protein
MTLEAFHKRHPDASSSTSSSTSTSSRDEVEGEEVLRCARCANAITSVRARIARADRHEHTCINPGGYVYRIGCFAKAPGVTPVGEPSAEWSWFEGYRWQVVRCSACVDLSGWHFTSSADSFFGLILNKLVSG